VTVTIAIVLNRIGDDAPGACAAPICTSRAKADPKAAGQPGLLNEAAVPRVQALSSRYAHPSDCCGSRGQPITSDQQNLDVENCGSTGGHRLAEGTECASETSSITKRPLIDLVGVELCGTIAPRCIVGSG
jgi:hypothetical protein